MLAGKTVIERVSNQVEKSIGDVYVAIGEPLGDGAWALRVHIKPFVRWIWLGAALMALGGFVTAADRRFRNHRKSEATPA